MSSYLTGGLRQLYQHITTSSTIPIYDYGEFTNSNGHFNLHRDCIMASRYRVLKILNTEGQSAVLVQAEDLFCFKKLVVIKILHTELYQLGTQETHCMWRLSCNDPDGLSGTVKLLNVFSFDDHFCMVLEPLQPDPLNRIFHNISREQLLPGIRKVALRVLSTLGFLRQQNVIHADLKPDNLLLKRANDLSSVKVVDFGNALHYVHKEVSLYYDDFEVQTPLYRAPEVMFGLPFGTEIDMWSLGCILAELYLGRHLFVGTSKEEILQEIVKLFGPFPSNLFQRGKFYQDQRQYTDNCVQPNGTIALMKCSIKDYDFRSFLSGLLRYDPDERLTPFQAAQHRFLAAEFPVGFLTPLPSGVTEAYPPVKVTTQNYSYSPKISSDIKRSQPSSRDLLRIGTSSPELDQHDVKNGILCPRSHDFSKIAKVNPVQRTPSVMSEESTDVISPESGDYNDLSHTRTSLSAESADNVHRPHNARHRVTLIDNRENNNEMQQILVSRTPGNDHMNDRHNNMSEQPSESGLRVDNPIFQSSASRLPNSSLIHSENPDYRIANHDSISSMPSRNNHVSLQNEVQNSILSQSHRNSSEQQNISAFENNGHMQHQSRQEVQMRDNSDDHSDTSPYNEIRNIVNQNKTENEQKSISDTVQVKSEQDEYITSIHEQCHTESELIFPSWKNDSKMLQLNLTERLPVRVKSEPPGRVPIKNRHVINSDGNMCSTSSQSPRRIPTAKEEYGDTQNIQGRILTENHNKVQNIKFKSTRPCLSGSNTRFTKRYSDPLKTYSSSTSSCNAAMSGQRETTAMDNSDVAVQSCDVKTESENSKKRRKTSSISDLKSLMNQIKQEQDIVEQDLSHKEQDNQLRWTSPSRKCQGFTVGSSDDNVVSPVLAGAPDIKCLRKGNTNKKLDEQYKDNSSQIRMKTSCDHVIFNNEDNYFTKALESEIDKSVKGGKQPDCTTVTSNNRNRHNQASRQNSKRKSLNSYNDKARIESKTNVKSLGIEGYILSSCQKTSKNMSVKTCKTVNNSVANTQLFCTTQNPTEEQLSVRKKQKRNLNARKRLPFSGPNTSTKIKNYLHVLKINKGSKKPRVSKNREVKKVKIKNVLKTENMFNNIDDPYSFIETPTRSKLVSSTMTKGVTKSSLTQFSESDDKCVTLIGNPDTVSSNRRSLNNTQIGEDFTFSSTTEDMKTNSILISSQISESKHKLDRSKSELHGVSSTRKSVNKNRSIGERKQTNNGLKCLKSVRKSKTPSKQDVNYMLQQTSSSTKKRTSVKNCETFSFDSSPDNAEKIKKPSLSGVKMKSKCDDKEEVKGKVSRRLTEENDDKHIKVYPDSDDSSYSDYIQLCGSPAAVGGTSKENKSVESRHWFEEEDEIMLLQG